MDNNAIKDKEKFIEYLNKTMNKKEILHRYKVFDSEPIQIDCDFSRFGCDEEDFWSYFEYLMEHGE